MDLKAKKEWLWRYRDAMREVERLERLVWERREAAMGKAAAPVDGLPRPPVRSNSTDSLMAWYVDTRDELEAARRKAEERRREILEATGALAADNAAVLRYRYINGYDWRAIAEAMRYSRSWALAKHREALESLDIEETVD